MKFLRWLDENLEQTILVFVTSLMLAMLGCAVFSRYVINISISWAEELSIFGMVWMTYFGASYAAKHRRHIRITIIPDLLAPKNKKMVDLVVNIVFILFMLFLAYGTWNMTALAFATGQKASASGIPRWIAIGSLPAAFMLTVVRLLQDSKKLLTEYKILAAGGSIDDNAFTAAIKMEE